MSNKHAKPQGRLGFRSMDSTQIEDELCFVQRLSKSLILYCSLTELCNEKLDELFQTSVLLS